MGITRDQCFTKTDKLLCEIAESLQKQNKLLESLLDKKEVKRKKKGE